MGKNWVYFETGHMLMSQSVDIFFLFLSADGLSFGNSICRIQFDKEFSEKVSDRVLNLDKLLMQIC